MTCYVSQPALRGGVSTRWPRPLWPARKRGALADRRPGFRVEDGEGCHGPDRWPPGGAGQPRLAEPGIELGDLVQRAEALRRDGQTVMFVAVDGQPAGLLGVADPIKLDA